MSKVVTITLNPAYDTTIELEELSARQINRPLSETKMPAGKGINISETLKTLDTPTIAVAVVGRDSLESFRQPLFEKCLECRFIVTDGAVRENLTILADGKTYKINRSGDEVDEQADGRLLALLADLYAPGDVAVFSGSVPKGIDDEKLERLIRNTAARGYKIVIDSESIGVDMLCRIKPWLIKPNEFEIEKITGRAFGNEGEMLEACRELVEKGIEQVVLSMGKKGLYAVTANEAVMAVPPETKAVNTVGAGDCALAGFISRAMKGESLAGCAAFAAACGTTAVQSPLPYIEDEEKVTQTAKTIVVTDVTK